jgi:hypothetical protein
MNCLVYSNSAFTFLCRKLTTMGSTPSREASTTADYPVQAQDARNNNDSDRVERKGIRNQRDDDNETWAVKQGPIQGGAEQAAASSTSSASGKTHKPHQQRSGMDLVNHECRKGKRAYQKCVNTWYSKGFITGNTSSLNQEEACGDLFDDYRACVLRGIRREFWDREGLPPPEEGPLADVSMEDDADERRTKK